MSVTLWIDTEREETIELGGTLVVYKAFADMARAAGKRWKTDFADLSGVLSQCEDQTDADPEWLADVRRQAKLLLGHYEHHLSADAQGILQQLAGEDA